jgi:hypothetical protein
MPHFLQHRTSVFKDISERPVIFTFECCALGEGTITTYFKRFGLTRPARAGLELTTSWMLSESTTTKLPVQEVDERQPYLNIQIRQVEYLKGQIFQFEYMYFKMNVNVSIILIDLIKQIFILVLSTSTK